ncbi:MAG: 16S rRNA (guanine(966)-N(2))-methyltransferase RsmD [Christensenellales bacterium]|jgi:16S rRNA (guanine966-N2)-methyltransferase
MRVIGGIYKGRNLIKPLNYDIRPTGAMVKEAIFGKLQFMISGASALDLFAGTGAMGIEALSRGASTVIFNDISPSAVKIIRKNLENIRSSSKVYCLDYKDLLTRLKGSRMDFIFIDPPYKEDFSKTLLNLIAVNDILRADGMIIYEHDRQKDLNFDKTQYILIDVKRYSSCAVSYLKRKNI